MAKTIDGISAVLFDYGMVLSAPPKAEAWEKMKTITGLEQDRLHEGYWASRHAYDRGTHTGEEYWAKVGLAGGIALDDGRIAALIDADNELWTELNAPMVTWARGLQRAGVKTGILSNLGDHMMMGLVRKFDWIDDFDHKTWSHTLKIAKPELEIYRHAIAGLETAPREILFIDDREENIAAAIASGMQGIQYSTHEAFEHEMRERGFRELLDAGMRPGV